MRDPRLENNSPAAPYNVRSEREDGPGYGYWDPTTDGDVECRGVSAKVSHGGLTLTANTDDTPGNEIEIKFLFNVDIDAVEVTEEDRVFTVSTPEASMTAQEFDEVYLDNDLLFMRLMNKTGVSTAAEMPPKLTFTGGRSFLQVEKMVINGSGTVMLVGIGDMDSQAVAYGFRDGQEVLMRFDKILATGTTVTGITLFGH